VRALRRACGAGRGASVGCLPPACCRKHRRRRRSVPRRRLFWRRSDGGGRRRTDASIWRRRRRNLHVVDLLVGRRGGEERSHHRRLGGLDSGCREPEVAGQAPGQARRNAEHLLSPAGVGLGSRSAPAGNAGCVSGKWMHFVEVRWPRGRGAGRGGCKCPRYQVCRQGGGNRGRLGQYVTRCAGHALRRGRLFLKGPAISAVAVACGGADAPATADIVPMGHF